MAIVSPNFCAPYPIDLGIARKLMTGKLFVTDANGDILFKMEESLFSLSSRCDKMILVDASDTPILTLKELKSSRHDRWQVFRGRGTYRNELLYTLNVSSKIKQGVFLADNEEMKECDFLVKGSLIDGSFVVYAGKSDVIVAKMNNEHTGDSILIGGNCWVTVYPNVDYAFIVSLIVILDEINREDSEDYT